MTRRLYMALVAYYTGFFNTPKSLQLDLDLSRSRIPTQLKDGLVEYFRAIVDRRLDFCKTSHPGTELRGQRLTWLQTRCSGPPGTTSTASSQMPSLRTSSSGF